MLIEAEAYRTDGLLTVKLIGQSPTPCDEAAIVGYYPGTIMHLTDPGSAQVYIRENRKPDMKNIYCPPGCGRIWMYNQIIRDNFHQTVEIWINDHLVLKIRILEHSFKDIHNIH